MSFDLRAALNGIFMKGKYSVGPDYSQFAINQYLSKYKQYIVILEQIMCLKLSNQAHFDYLQKVVNFGWPSKREIKAAEEDPLIKYLMQAYECSRLDARDYLIFISDQEKADLIDYYKGDE